MEFNSSKLQEDNILIQKYEIELNLYQDQLKSLRQENTKLEEEIMKLNDLEEVNRVEMKKQKRDFLKEIGKRDSIYEGQVGNLKGEYDKIMKKLQQQVQDYRQKYQRLLEKSNHGEYLKIVDEFCLTF